MLLFLLNNLDLIILDDEQIKIKKNIKSKITKTAIITYAQLEILLDEFSLSYSTALTY